MCNGLMECRIRSRNRSNERKRAATVDSAIYYEVEAAKVCK